MVLWIWDCVVVFLGGYGLSPRVVALGALATFICLVGTSWVLVEERGVKGVYERYCFRRIAVWFRKYLSRHNRLVEEAKRVSHLGSTDDHHGKKAKKAHPNAIREVSMKRILIEASRQIRPKFVFPATLFSILVCLVNFLEPVMIGRFWDAVEKVKQTGDYRPAANLLGVRALCIAVRYVLHVIVGMIFSKAKGDMTARMRKEVFSRLLSQDTKFYDACKSAELLDRLKRDPESLEEFVNHTLERFFQAVVDLFCGLYLVRNYPWYLWGGAIVLKALPVTMITVRAGKLCSMYAVVQRHSLQQADAVACESLVNITTVRTHVGEEAEEARHHNKTKQYLEVLMHTLYTDALLRYLRVFVRQTMELGFVTLGAYCIIFESEFTMGKFMAFRSILDMLLRGLFTFADLYTQIGKLKRTSVRYFDLLDGKPEIESIRTWSPNHPMWAKSTRSPKEQVDVNNYNFEGRLAFESVSFCYPGRPNTQVLHNVSFEVQPGQILALVGPSGMGKSTILKLILRLYDPEMGRVLIDGRDIRSLDTKLYRHRIGYVTQEPALFDCSIAENIAYGLHLDMQVKPSTSSSTTKKWQDNPLVSNLNGDPGEARGDDDHHRSGHCDGDGGRVSRVVTMADVKQAAMMACAHEFIAALPQGYDTPVGPGGVLLSGGQRQRIAIARAIIRDPKILLVDEPTSHLDPESEKNIGMAIDNLVPGRTVCVIAHRMAMIRRANKIAVINKGQIVQFGSHDDLMKDTDGKYYNYVQAEMLKAETPTP